MPHHWHGEPPVWRQIQMASTAHTPYPAQLDSDGALYPKLCSNMLSMLTGRRRTRSSLYIPPVAQVSARSYRGAQERYCLTKTSQQMPPAMTFQKNSPRQADLAAPPADVAAVCVVQVPNEETTQEHGETCESRKQVQRRIMNVAATNQ